jgi:hypothetical protein
VPEEALNCVSAFPQSEAELEKVGAVGGAITLIVYENSEFPGPHVPLLSANQQEPS